MRPLEGFGIGPFIDRNLDHLAPDGIASDWRSVSLMKSSEKFFPGVFFSTFHLFLRAITSPSLANLRESLNVRNRGNRRLRLAA